MNSVIEPLQTHGKDTGSPCGNVTHSRHAVRFDAWHVVIGSVVGIAAYLAQSAGFNPTAFQAVGFQPPSPRMKEWWNTAIARTRSTTLSTT